MFETVLDAVAKYNCGPHIYMSEGLATSDCVHYRFFRVAQVVVCCGCGHVSPSPGCVGEIGLSLEIAEALR